MDAETTALGRGVDAFYEQDEGIRPQPVSSLCQVSLQRLSDAMRIISDLSEEAEAFPSHLPLASGAKLLWRVMGGGWLGFQLGGF